MRKTSKNNIGNQTFLIDTTDLQNMLSSGRASAVRVGTDAGAKVQIGRRVFWNTKKIQNYIDSISR